MLQLLSFLWPPPILLLLTTIGGFLSCLVVLKKVWWDADEENANFLYDDGLIFASLF